MFFQLLMMTVTVTQCTGIPEIACDRLRIGNEFYNKHILWTDVGRPYNLNVLKTTNTLFFSFSVSETYSDLDFQLAQLNMDTKEYVSIPGIRGGCAATIDQTNEEIYLGGSDGIYRYNLATRLADLYKEKDKNIWSLFYRRNLFYISYPEQRLYMELDGKFAIVKEFKNFEIDQFYTTNDGDIYFANSTGFYKYNKNNSIGEMIHDLITVRQITEDNKGKIYTCTNVGLFVLKELSLEKVLNMKNIYGLAFDRENNFVLSDEKRVMKLMKSNKSCDRNDHW